MGTLFEEKVENKIKKPSLYKVFLINDDYTTMEFVVEVIVQIFHRTIAEATKIMMDVHQKGKGIVGVYTYDIALTKVDQVKNRARTQGFPLMADIEEE